MRNILNDIKGTPFVGNVLSLFTIQLLNYIIPLIIIPVLSNALGENNFGVFSFAQYFAALLFVFCDYGFVYTGPIQVSKEQNNRERLIDLFSTIMFLKFAFFVFVSIITIIYLSFFDQDCGELLLVALLGVLGNVLTPVWFLQGYQKLRGLTIVNLFVKLGQLIFIVTMVDGKEDLMLAGYLFFGSNLLLGLVSYVYTVLQFRLKLKVPTKAGLKTELSKGFVMFTSVFFSSLYINGTGVLLKIITGNDAVVGEFSIAEKIVRAVTYLFNPISAAFYPMVSKVFHESKEKGIQLFFKFIRLTAVLTLLALVFMNLFVWYFFDMFFKPEFHSAIFLVLILSPIVVFGNIGNMVGNNLFMQLGWQRSTAVVSMLLAGINLLFCTLLIPEFQAAGASITMTVTEVLSPVILIGLYKTYLKKV